MYMHPDIKTWPVPSPERLIAERQQLLDSGFHLLLTAYPDTESGKLDMKAVDQIMTEREEALGGANVAAVSASFDLRGSLRDTDEVMTIYVRDREPRLF